MVNWQYFLFWERRGCLNRDENMKKHADCAMLELEDVGRDMTEQN